MDDCTTNPPTPFLCQAPASAQKPAHAVPLSSARQRPETPKEKPGWPFDITDFTTALTLHSIHLVENLLVLKFSAKQGAVARTASFVLFPANKSKKKCRHRKLERQAVVVAPTCSSARVQEAGDCQQVASRELAWRQLASPSPRKPPGRLAWTWT